MSDPGQSRELQFIGSKFLTDESIYRLEVVPRIYCFCLAPTKNPANPEKMAARQIGKIV
jgi:hypothetical protein